MASTFDASMDDWKSSYLERRRADDDSEARAALQYTLSHHKIPSYVVPVLPGGDQCDIGDPLPASWTPEVLPFHDTCEPCFGQYFPVTHEINDQDAHKVILEAVESARRDNDLLRQMIRDHADLIVSRWKNKSRKQRSAILSDIGLYKEKFAAVHLIHQHSHPDAWEDIIKLVEFYEKRGTRLEADVIKTLHIRNIEKAVESFKYTWAMPYLDSETLADDPLLLLSLLHNRTAHDPEEWVLFDDWNMDLAERFGIVKQLFNTHCVVMEGPEFGKLVKWKKEESHRYQIVGFAKAFNILLAQQKMMRFLRSCVEMLFLDIEAPPILAIQPKWEGLIALEFSRFTHTSMWSTEFVKPFSCPPNFDVANIADLVESRHALLKDDLDQLLTDPSHLQTQVHHLVSATWFEKLDEERKWRCIVHQIVRNPIRRERMWSYLAIKCDEMLSAWRADTQSPSSSTEYNLEQAITRVREFCIEMFCLFGHDVDSSLILQRGFEDNHKIQGRGVTQSLIASDYFPQDLLYWSISTIGHDRYRSHTADPSLNFSVVDEICRKEPKQAARIDQEMLNLLSEMAILHSISQSIHLRRHQNRVHSDKQAEESSTGWTQFCKIHQTLVDEELVDDVAPALREFCTSVAWPTGKKDQNWLKQATRCCAELRSFWETFTLVWSRQLNHHDVNEVTNVLGFMNAINDENFLDVIKLTITAPLRPRLATANVENVQTFWENGKDSSAQLPIRDTKKKRRSAKQQQQQQLQEMENQPDEPAPTRCVYVGRENFDTLMHMYPGIGHESQKKIKWERFLSAMVDVGFAITQSSGSAVTFTLGGDQQPISSNRAITFHRPHPNPELHNHRLRNIGKRLYRQFGWSRENFAIRGVEERE
jgi:hypothetical protein